MLLLSFSPTRWDSPGTLGSRHLFLMAFQTRGWQGCSLLSRNAVTLDWGQQPWSAEGQRAGVLGFAQLRPFTVKAAWTARGPTGVTESPYLQKWWWPDMTQGQAIAHLWPGYSFMDVPTMASLGWPQRCYPALLFFCGFSFHTRQRFPGLDLRFHKGRNWAGSQVPRISSELHQSLWEVNAPRALVRAVLGWRRGRGDGCAVRLGLWLGWCPAWTSPPRYPGHSNPARAHHAQIFGVTLYSLGPSTPRSVHQRILSIEPQKCLRSLPPSMASSAPSASLPTLPCLVDPPLSSLWSCRSELWKT